MEMQWPQPVVAGRMDESVVRGLALEAQSMPGRSPETFMGLAAEF